LLRHLGESTHEETHVEGNLGVGISIVVIFAGALEIELVRSNPRVVMIQYWSCAMFLFAAWTLVSFLMQQKQKNRK
jgi:hypothetical protein